MSQGHKQAPSWLLCWESWGPAFLKRPPQRTLTAATMSVGDGGAQGGCRIAHAYGWPVGTTEAMVWEWFPTAIDLELRDASLNTWYALVAVLRFPSASIALKAAKGWATGDGRPLGCWEGGTYVAEDRDKVIAAGREHVLERMVLVRGCPIGISEALLWDKFPTAQVVGLRSKPFTGEAAVSFGTAAVAQAVAALGTVVIKGTTLRMEWGGWTEQSYDDDPTKEKMLEDVVPLPPSDVNGIIPHALLQEAVAESTGTAAFPLQPSGDNAEQSVPRDAMDDPVQAETAPSLPPDNATEIPKHIAERMKRVMTTGWPEGTTRAAVKAAFPTARGLQLQMDGERFTGTAWLYFKTAEAAREAAGMQTVGGTTVFAKWFGATSRELRAQSRILSVRTDGWPEGTTEQIVRDVFPTATAVVLRKKGAAQITRAKLFFATVEAAREATEKGACLGNSIIHTDWAGARDYALYVSQTKETEKVVPGTTRMPIQLDPGTERTPAHFTYSDSDREITQGRAPVASCIIPNVCPDSRQAQKVQLRQQRLQRRDEIKARRVTVSGFPNGTTVEAIKRAFSTAAAVQLRKKGTAAAVDFATPEAAEEAAQKGATIEDHLLLLKYAGDSREQKMQRRCEEKSRQVTANGWPGGATVDTVKEAFPGASAVLLSKKGTTAVMHFPTPEAAREAAQNGATVEGHALHMIYAGEIREQKLWRVHEEKIRRVTARGFPNGTKTEAVTEAFPTAVAVVMQSKGTSAVMHFATPEAAQEAAHKGSTVGGHTLQTIYAGENRDQKKQRLYEAKLHRVTARCLPGGTTVQEIKEAFPRVGVVLLQKKGRSAVMHFITPEAAQEAAQKGATLRGHTLQLVYAGYRIL